MIKNKVGSVVVLGFDGEPAGIVTERDILKRVTAVGKSPDKVSLQDFMSKPVITIKSYDSIETAATIMSKNKIKRLVVLEQDGSLAGVISVTDVTRRLAKILTDEYNRFSHLKAILDS
jgi:CBS domain-containing protein